MDYQKDTKNNTTHSYGQHDVLASKDLQNKPLYDFVNKKTEKLVTALYMVTDCMDTDDALKSKIRLLGVELLSDMYRLANLSAIDKRAHTVISLGHIHEVLSFVDIACTIGFISEMNGGILKRELLLLSEELQSSQSADQHFTFALDEKMFDIPKPSVSRAPSIKDTPAPTDKKTYGLSFRTQVSPAMSLSKGSSKTTSHPIDKLERTTKILSLIKDTSIGQTGVSIKDISNAFTDVSEKTIQRELNSMVTKGQIKKTGAKRWSRYQSI